MFRTTAGALMLTLFAVVRPAAAAGHEVGSTNSDPQAAVAMAGFVSAAMPALGASVVLTAPPSADVSWSLPPVRFGPRRGAALPVLYISLAGLNAYDAYSTTMGVSKGHTESNPLIRGAAGNPAAIWAIKSGVTVGAITLAERLWRHDKRVQAVAVMIVSNGMMAAVAAHNASVLRRQ